MGTAEELALGFDTVTNDPASAVIAGRSEDVDCALKAVEDVRVSITHPDFECLVVRVAAEFAGAHGVTCLGSGPDATPAAKKQRAAFV